MTTPLLTIRVSRSDDAAFHRGQRFDTLADFDATLRAAGRTRRAAEPGEVATLGVVHFEIRWKDGASFHGRYDLDHPTQGVVEHVIQACRGVLADRRFSVLLAGAQLTVLHLFEAAKAEHHLARRRGGASQEVPCPQF